jgi:hypothetical protein
MRFIHSEDLTNKDATTLEQLNRKTIISQYRLRKKMVATFL